MKMLFAIRQAIVFCLWAPMFFGEAIAGEDLWQYSDDAVQCLNGDYASIRHADLSGMDWPPGHFIERASNLQTLVIVGPHCTDKILSSIEKLELLQTLVLDSTDITAEGVETLRENRPELTVLRSQRWAIAEIRELGGQVGLEPSPNDGDPTLRALLDVEHFRRATQVALVRQDHTYPELRSLLNEDLMPLKYLDSVQRLNLSDARINDAGMHYLKGLTRVESLHIPLDEVSPRSLALLRGMKNLKSFSGNPNDEGMKYIGRFKQLEFLATGGPELTDAGLAHLRGLHQLKTLFLQRTGIRGAGFKRLADLPELEMLIIEDSPLDELTHIAAIHPLKHLHIENTEVDDDAVAQLANCENLESLSITGTKVTDAGITQLKSLPKLRSLKIAGGTVTEEGLERMRRGLELK